MTTAATRARLGKPLLEHKRGTTFRAIFRLEDVVDPSWDLRAAARGTGDNMVTVLSTRAIGEVPTALVEVAATAEQTEEWVAGEIMRVDMRAESPDGEVVQSTTEQIMVIEKVTQ